MKTISLRLSQELKEAIEKYAADDQRSLNSFIVVLLMTEHLKRQKNG